MAVAQAQATSRLPGPKHLFRESYQKFRANLGIILQVTIVGQVFQLLFSATDGVWGWFWSVVVLSALLWVVVRLGQQKKLRLKDAYYKGTASFLRLALVAFWLTLMLLPAVAGQLIYSLALTPGLAPSLGEGAVAGSLSLLLLLLSLYLVARSIFALFSVASSPIGPFSAVWASFRLTRGRIKTLSYRLGPLFLVLLGLVILLFIVLEYLPLAINAAVLTAVSGVFLSVLLLPYALIYLFEVFKGLKR